MAQFAASHGLALRPHAKTHKSVEVARRQIASGAIGVCCAKIGEAEALATGGITGIHITSPVVSAPAIERLIALAARDADLMVVADSVENAAALGRAAAAAGVTLNVILDIDPGLGRTGVASAEAAVELSRAIRADAALCYRGVQFYCGVEQHIAEASERRATVREKTDYLQYVITALTEDGAAPRIVTGGGTGTHEIDAELGVLTELQAGSYVFMDVEYLACGTLRAPHYETALFVETRVVSANAPGLVTVDGGLKSFATEAGPPEIVGGAPDGATYLFMGDEHGAVLLPDDAPRPRLGEMITLLTPHCDPTVNLYETYHVVRGDTLIDLWPVDARGRSR
jgi:D-serine deaminase-like pyridoxal phosphate-dependent protein